MKIKNESIPLSWDYVTYEQSMNLLSAKDTADVLSVFLNIKADTLRKATIINITELIRRIAFLNDKPPEILPRSINGFLIPPDLNFKSICRFEDLKAVVAKVIPKEGETFGRQHMEHYPEIVAIYAMPNYENATPQEREQFAKQFFKSPCGEVLAIGNFTLAKFTELSLPGLKHFRKLRTLIHKLKLALKSYSARLAFSVLFFLWKRKHRINVTNS